MIERLRALLRRSGGREASLAEAALLVAADEYADLDVAGYLAKLAAHGDRARAAIAAAGAEGRAAIAILSAYLFRDVGLRGNRADYYDPRNSFVNEVLDRRLGIPITLSIVYVEVGRRAGLRPEPVGFPGHFLVKHELGDGVEAVVLDPFEAGRVLGRADLEALLAERFGLDVSFGPQLLRAAEPREVVARILRNLKGVYLKRGDLDRAYRTTDRLVAVEPGAREERRDRGLLAARIGRLPRALCDLVAYARGLPDTLERRTIREAIEGLRRRQAEMG